MFTRLPTILIVVLYTVLSRSAHAQAFIYDRPPIHYSGATTNDPIARLQQKLDSGKAKLKFDGHHGYLRSLLDVLKIPHSSQLLVYSKTSLQLRLIAPWSPRAIYFDDSTYVGWIPESDVLEISTVDPNKGAIFYTLHQRKSNRPRFKRDSGNCLSCHGAARTYGVPGHLMRSLYTSPTGLPFFGAGTYRTNHSSPLKERWGGWFVTGKHGKQRHMGNVLAYDRARPTKIDIEAGANVTDLDKLTNVDLYLTRHSDIVALMVLGHQTDMHNFITLANFETRTALNYNKEFNRVLDRPAGFISESTRRRIKSVGEKLVKYLLFCDEAKLTDRIVGTTNYAKQFASLGRRDKQGRSLRDFDLRKRMFKYPCSYLINSAAFHALPAETRKYVFQQLYDVLQGKDNSQPFAHLTKADRKAIYEILMETHRGLPRYWKRQQP